MDLKHHLHTHHHKIKTWSIYIFIFALIAYLGFSVYSTYNAFQGGQCREFFDIQTIENKKRICCNPDQYNSKDSLCKVKCDALETNPNSPYCQNLLQSQGILPIAKEIQKPLPIPNEIPKCTGLVVSSKDGSMTLKPSNPIKFDYSFKATDIRPKYYIYELYTFENNDINTLKPISFVPGKTLFGISPATIAADGSYKDSFTALHENLFQENLNKGNKIPEDVLMIVSIVDQSDKKYLQPSYCFAKFKVDNTPSYCKSFKVNQEVLSDGEELKLSVESNLPITYSYDFRFLNLDNYQTINGSKEYKEISYNKAGNTNQSFAITKEARGASSLKIEIPWKDFYQPDLNNKNKYPESIRVLAYLKPTADSKIENIAPCKANFELDKDSGIDNCKELNISGGTTNPDKSITLKPNQYVTLEGISKSRNIERFEFSFFNLDNLITQKEKYGIKNAAPIYFSKSNPFEITKTTSKTDTKSIIVSYDDFNKVDLGTGSRPKNIQARVTFINTDDRSSKIDKNCTVTFKVE